MKTWKEILDEGLSKLWDSRYPPDETTHMQPGEWDLMYPEDGES